MKTYKEMCEVIAQDWNSNQREQITWEQIWNAPQIGRFPALYIPYMYEAAKEGHLLGLLMSNEDCCKIFLTQILKT